MTLREPEFGDRELVENAVAGLAAGLPAGWSRLRVEAQPSSEPPLVEAAVTTANGQEQSVQVSPEVLAVLAEHQSRAAAADTPWRRLVIDCYSDGRLSAYTDETPGLRASTGAGRRASQVLAAVTGCLLVVAGSVFAVAWRWGPPPRAEMTALPLPPPRQKDAFDVVNKWFDAENRADAPDMMAVTCRRPSQTVLDWISSTAQFGQVEGFVFPDAVIGFRDQGAHLWVKAAVRIRPISENQKRMVAQQRQYGGFFTDELTLADEEGSLKVCDIVVPQ
ncbi:hypothetical protein [Mycobacteroides salmoniphilum]|uniref:Uncharacterized protein n=1 Tax=Mycobacteroides salmoniphilum TaxID=404941 RepID=A0A4V3I100_9MYCO|nr:hypothetical protein [Mycobacteroides salmoniphilum]TEA06101.1 hypothetical protein CCUG60884_01238 [Mycobacteroides salmoniphilum]